MEVKIGFCVAYDWEMLKYSLPLVYTHADRICLSLDGDRVSWAGEKFHFDETQFQSFLTLIDTQKKIYVLEESFYLTGFSPMQNEVRQRNRMAESLGKGGWHIQLDCDEYFIDFNQFVQFLQESRNVRFKKTNICCGLITIFKKVSNGFLIIDRRDKYHIEAIAIATTEPFYEYGRRNGHFNFHTKFQILHQSWARNEEDILLKVKNWGHKNDFDAMRFLGLWKSIDENNYKQIINFHPIQALQWHSLRYIRADSIEDLIAKIRTLKIKTYSNWELALKNSRLFSKINAVLR